MDEMKFMGGFATRILAKLLEKVIKKKTGADVGIIFKEVKATTSDDVVKMHFEGDLDLSQTSFSNLLKKIDLI